MTPRKWAQEVARKIRIDAEQCDDVDKFIEQAIIAAIKEEREACAAIAEHILIQSEDSYRTEMAREYPDSVRTARWRAAQGAAGDIAAQIRARLNSEPEAK